MNCWVNSWSPGTWYRPSNDMWWSNTVTYHTKHPCHNVMCVYKTLLWFDSDRMALGEPTILTCIQHNVLGGLYCMCMCGMLYTSKIWRGTHTAVWFHGWRPINWIVARVLGLEVHFNRSFRLVMSHDSWHIMLARYREISRASQVIRMWKGEFPTSQDSSR